jgi:hypothetical protein
MASGQWIPNLINLLVGYIILMFWAILSPLLALFGMWGTFNQAYVAAIAGAMPSKVK